MDLEGYIQTKSECPWDGDLLIDDTVGIGPWVTLQAIILNVNPKVTTGNKEAG